MSNWIIRKLLLTLIAMFNSEILSTAQTFGTLFSDPLILSIYFFSFLIMDELVQKYNLDNKAIFYLGSIFGLILEGFVAFTLIEDPFGMILFIAILWHGLITTLAAFMIVDIITPSKKEKIHKIWMILGTIFLCGLLLVTMGTNLEILISQWLVFTVAIVLILIFVFLIRLSISKGDKKIPKAYLSIVFIISGFIAGLFIKDKLPTLIDYSILIIFYITIFIFLLKKKRTHF